MMPFANYTTTSNYTLEDTPINIPPKNDSIKQYYNEEEYELPDPNNIIMENNDVIQENYETVLGAQTSHLSDEEEYTYMESTLEKGSPVSTQGGKQIEEELYESI